MTIIENLKHLGLNETESQIYLKLLKIGESTAVSLSKEIKIHRRTIYDNLNILIKKGIVNYVIKNKIKYFKANNPNVFKSILEEKDKILTNILPILIDQYNNEFKSPEISIHVGIEGAISILEEIISQKKILYWAGAGGVLLDSLSPSKFRLIMERFKDLKLNMIQPDKKDVIEKAQRLNPTKLRILPKDYQISPELAFFICGDYALLGLIENKDITLIKILSKGFANGFKSYFDILWNLSKPIKNETITK